MFLVVTRRYILKAGTLAIETPAGVFEREHWIGVEIASVRPVDLGEFSRRGFDLVPADGMSVDELASVNVATFHRVVLDGRCVEEEG